MKRALVTGASDGIGLSYALKLAAEGYTVTAVARREEKLKSLIQKIGPAHDYVVADLSTEKGIQTIKSRLSQDKYQLLVNNAGSGMIGQFAELSLEKQLSMVTLNCLAPLSLMHHFLQTATAGDAIVNVSSMLSIFPMPNLALYSATKAFLSSLSESVWYETKSKGILVLNICPGSTDTEFRTVAGGNPKKRENLMLQTPDQVVAVTLQSLSRNCPTVYSGLFNKFVGFLPRFFSRKMIINVLGFASRRLY